MSILTLISCLNYSQVTLVFAILVGLALAQPSKNELLADLLRAVAREDVEQVKILLAKGAPVNGSNLSGATPLHYATENVLIAKILLENGANIRIKDALGMTALHRASWRGSDKIVALLISKGADPTERNSVGKSALDLAIENRHESVVQVYRDAGYLDKPKPETVESKPKDPVSELLSEVKRGNTKNIQILLDEGVDINAADDDGYTAMHTVANGDKVHVAQFLLENGAKLDPVDNSGGTPLHQATLNGYDNMVAFLLSKGADTTVKDKLGRSPVDVAIAEDQEQVLKAYRKLGLTTFVAQAYGSTTPLHEAVAGGQTIRVLSLLRSGTDVNAPDAQGMSPLHHAVSNKNFDIVNALVNNGAKSYADNEKRTPLDIALTLNDHKLSFLLRTRL